MSYIANCEVQIANLGMAPRSIPICIFQFAICNLHCDSASALKGTTSDHGHFRRHFDLRISGADPADVFGEGHRARG